MKRKPIDDLREANRFRDEMVGRADGNSHGSYPWWYGWAIVEAYLAGLEAGRQEAKKSAPKGRSR